MTCGRHPSYIDHAEESFVKYKEGIMQRFEMICIVLDRILSKDVTVDDVFSIELLE